MESTTRTLLKRQIQKSIDQKRRDGDGDKLEAEHAALRDTLDRLKEEHRGVDCEMLRKLVEDEYPDLYSHFEIYYALNV